MQLHEVLAKLEAAGTEQARKIYKRHGVNTPMFGVSYAELGKLVKSIKRDQALAEGLWKSGNHDARVLAAMIADPAKVSAHTLDGWSKELGNTVVVDAFAKLVAVTPFAKDKAVAWCESRDEWIGAAGWMLVNLLAMEDKSLPDAFFVKYVKDAESKIRQSKNRVRYTMLCALIGIGLRNPKLEGLVLTAAKAIGDVEIDHGETGCKTPVVADYIAKTKARYAGVAKGAPRLGRPKAKK